MTILIVAPVIVMATIDLGVGRVDIQHARCPGAIVSFDRAANARSEYVNRWVACGLVGDLGGHDDGGEGIL
jgi:hypothetical protein